MRRHICTHTPCLANRSKCLEGPPSISWEAEASLPHWNERARQLGGKDVRVGGGVQKRSDNTSAPVMSTKFISLVAPVVLGQGEALFADLDLRALGYRPVEHVSTDQATHVILARPT